MISIAKTHPYSHCPNGFGVSHLMQEKMAFAGQYDNYGKCNSIIDTMLGQSVSSAQVYRVTQVYGASLTFEGQSEAKLAPPIREECVYVEVDGSLILTRESGWKEVKVGRVFKSKDCMKLSKNRPYIQDSQYVSYLGKKEPFCRAMDELIDNLGGNLLAERLIFINDGASWIANWSQDLFPKAVHILDYYHVLEHLYNFVNLHFEQEQEGKIWAKVQEQLLLNSGVEQVLSNISALRPKSATTKKCQDQLLNYYRNNIPRMDYRRYKTLGAGIIGSGAVESAHRTVVQKRLKQSGQRWGHTGAQNVLNLRVTHMNGQWNKVVDLIRSAA